MTIKIEMGDFDIEKAVSEVPLDLPCPKCGGNVKASLNQIKRHETVVCPSCGVNVELQTTES